MNSGFLLIDKPKDWTSRDVCNKIQSILKNKKVGHCGTLDPFATGLLIVAVGNATKALSFLEGFTKEYVAVLSLGKKTDSGDLTGNVVEEKEIPTFTNLDLLNISKNMIGKSLQIPPMTSAIKVNGKKLYELAHKGIEIDREPREIEIYSLEMIQSNSKEIIFKANVSKGTYIRTLGEDIAVKLGTVGYLIDLRRTKINSINVEDAISLEKVDSSKLISVFDVLSKFMDVVQVDEQLAIKIKNGIALDGDICKKQSEQILLIDNAKNALAVYNKKKGKYYCQRGLW